MSQLAVGDFFILCHSGSDGVTCSVPWATVAWRTHQSNPENNHVYMYIIRFLVLCANSSRDYYI